MQFLYIEDIPNPEAELWASHLTALMGKEFVKVDAKDFDPSTEADLFFYSTSCNKKAVQRFLDMSRELRIPYIFITPQMQKLGILSKAEKPLHIVLAPVTMLEEEVHKAELLSHLARYTGAAVTLLTANDYGSRARANTGKIRSFLDARQQDLGLQYSIEERSATKDSLSLYKEVTDRQKDFLSDMIIQTASRDYGLDDILFGPAERRMILHSQVPVALLNPRGDLYSLCD